MTQEEIEKAAEDYAERKRLEFDDCSFKDTLKRDFKAGADFANKHWEEKTRWIPIEERLPERKLSGFSALVLTKNKHGNIMLERYDYDYNRFNGLRYGEEVTHWKEID